MDDTDTDTPAPELDEAPTPPPPRRLGLVAMVAAAVVVLDQLTKWWAQRTLADGAIDLVGPLRLNLLYNTGAAFSMGSGKGLGPWIALLAIVVVVGLSLGYTSRFPLGAVAAGLVTGGAIGNLLDRAFRGDAGFLHGAVVDFIDPQVWPVFNVADAGVVIGAILLAVAAFRADGAS